MDNMSGIARLKSREFLRWRSERNDGGDEVCPRGTEVGRNDSPRLR